MNIKKKITIENNKKIIFTAGPASLSEEKIIDLKPCFGRGDKEYAKIEKFVLSKISKISGLKNIATLRTRTLAHRAAVPWIYNRPL